MRWLAVWTRAVVVPAWRRAVAAWIGCGIVAAVVFGPTAMHPSDLTGLALHDAGVAIVLGATWLLVFLPTARLLVRAEPARYLESLPGSPRSARAVAAAALIGLQLPWLVLWLWGEQLVGLAIVAAMTGLIVVLARWRPPSVRARFPAWRGSGEALRAVHLRALRRRAGDAIVRGAGLSVLAGAAAGLLVRNNQAVAQAASQAVSDSLSDRLSAESAGVLGASIIAIVLVPAQIGVALVTLGAHRETAWLAASLGIARRTRIAALVAAVGIVHLIAAAIAVAAATAIAGPNGWLAALAGAIAIASALAEARTMIACEASPTAAARMVTGAVVFAAIAVVCLAVLDAPGAIAALAIGAFALLQGAA
ncbi:MAG TPA: hypothetical protein VFK02_28395 [Kofleriaceae bacterium]|nr:hypothetical protein [Kofleriaceae bacterium]